MDFGFNPRLSNVDRCIQIAITHILGNMFPNVASNCWCRQQGLNYRNEGKAVC